MLTLSCSADACAGVATAASSGTAYVKVTGPANTYYDILATIYGGGGEEDSCVGHCGDKAFSGCGCDETCQEFGDCCDDFCDACPALCVG